MRIIPLDYETSKYFSALAPESVRILLTLPWIGGLGAVIGEENMAEVAGILLYDYDEEEGEFYITWIFVEERLRFQGIGETLLAQACIIAREKGLEGISVVYTEILGEEEYFENLEGYFAEKGISDKWNMPSSFLVDAETFSTLPFISMAEETNLNNVRPLKDIDLSEFNGFIKKEGHAGLEAHVFDQDASCGIYHNNVLKGVLVVLRGGDYYLPVTVIGVSDEDKDKLFLFTMRVIADNASVEDYIGLLCLTREAAKLFSHVFDEKDQYKTYAMAGEIEMVLENLGEEE